MSQNVPCEKNGCYVFACNMYILTVLSKVKAFELLPDAMLLESTALRHIIMMSVTQRGSWCPSGESANSSKPIIEGYMEKNMNNRLILFKIFTKSEFYDEK